MRHFVPAHLGLSAQKGGVNNEPATLLNYWVQGIAAFSEFKQASETAQRSGWRADDEMLRQQVGVAGCPAIPTPTIGIDGIHTTLDAFDAAGITHTGTARDPSEALPKLINVNGVRVAHVAFARNSNTGFPADWWRLRQAVTATNVIDDVAAARAAGAEVVIVSVHVFVEMQQGPTAEDRALIEQITAPAHPDLIIIHGPHVVQPVERVNGTLIYWSLGNFISGMGVPGRNKYSDLRTLDGLMATVRFTERADGSWATEPWTVLLCNVLGSCLVYPGLTTLADPTIPTSLRTQLEACVLRSSAVVSSLH